MSNLRMPAVGGAPGSSIAKDPAQAPDRAIDKDVARSAGLNPTPAGVDSFSQVLGNELTKPVQEPLKFSAHANARLQSRKLTMGPEQMQKLNEAVDKAAAKGLDDTLVLTKEGAFIVNVKNRTVVTALDRNSLDGNVFTNIDGAVIM